MWYLSITSDLKVYGAFVTTSSIHRQPASRAYLSQVVKHSSKEFVEKVAFLVRRIMGDPCVFVTVNHLRDLGYGVYFSISESE
jgi:hypothetical protein